MSCLPPGDRVVGLGSPHGDDAAGWLAVARLRARGDIQAELLEATPDRLTELCRGCRRLIVLDAARTDLPPGRVLRLVWPDPRILPGARGSSHALGLAESLQLAAALGWLPPRVLVLAVTIGHAQPGEPVGTAVIAALDELASAVLAELAEAGG